MIGWLLNLPFLLLWNVGYCLVRLLIVMRRWLSPGILMLLLVIIPLLLFLLPRLDQTGDYALITGSVALAFIAGTLSRQR